MDASKALRHLVLAKLKARPDAAALSGLADKLRFEKVATGFRVLLPDVTGALCEVAIGADEFTFYARDRELPPGARDPVRDANDAAAGKLIDRVLEVWDPNFAAAAKERELPVTAPAVTATPYGALAALALVAVALALW